MPPRKATSKRPTTIPQPIIVGCGIFVRLHVLQQALILPLFYGAEIDHVDDAVDFIGTQALGLVERQSYK